MEPLHVYKFEYKDFVSYTDNFSDTNYIGRFQYGKLYRGEYFKAVRTAYLLVKIWDVPEIYDYELGDNEIRLMEELVLLRHEAVIKHPVMVKLVGYCFDGEHLGVAYEFKPFDSVFNLIPKDDFTWLQRIKSALGLASVLRFLHAGHPSIYKPFVVRNLDAAHLVLDEEYNLLLCDFGSINGGVFNVGTTNSGQNAFGCYGYMDLRGGDCSSKQDVFAFGVILLSLIAKRVYTEEDRRAGAPFVYEWALKEFECAGTDYFSLVHESLSAECHFCPSDGHKITMLALECVNEVESERPSMKQVVRKLRKLEVVNQHADYLGADELLVYPPPSALPPLWKWS